MIKGIKGISLGFVLVAMLFTGCGGGGGGGSATGGNQTIPAAPTGVNVSIVGTEVVVKWFASAGATSYRLYYSETPGVTKASTYDTITGFPVYYSGQIISETYILDPGTYYVAMTALNAAGESSLSTPEITATVVAPFNGGTVTTFSGSGSMGYVDGTQNNAQFRAPRGLAADGTYIYVADSANNVIRAVAVTDGHAYTLAGNSNGYSGSTDGIWSAARFNAPSGVATDGTYVYVADTANSTIRRIELVTNFPVTTIAGTAGVTGSTDGAGASALFYYPRGLALHGNSLYVADSGNNTIRKINLTDNTVTTIAGSASTYAGSTDGSGVNARFNFPYGIAVNPTGTKLYIADRDNGSIRELTTATNSVTTLDTTVSKPTAVATDGTYLLVADAGTVGTSTTANTIAQIHIASGDVQVLAGGNISVVSGDGVGANASFNHPEGIALLGSTVYVADTLSQNIRKIE